MSASLDSEALARAMGVPAPTVRRWLRAWLGLGVAGIRTERSRGRYGLRYVCDAELPTRWRQGELPSPFAAAM
jgi:hypothetical protein